MLIEGTDMTMVRGDSEMIRVVRVNKNDERIDFVMGDNIKFTVKAHARTDVVKLYKEVTWFESGCAIIRIHPQDTKNMDFQTYVYDIQLTSDNGRVKTIIPSSSFIIREEITN